MRIRKRARVHRMKKMRGIQYKGFKIGMFNNGYYGFRYEYKLYPLGPQSLRLTGWRNKFYKVIHDASSTNSKKMALWFAKCHVKGMVKPELPWRGHDFVYNLNTRDK